jgi:ribonucleoside-diphosphate reductase alpha chain
MKELKEKDLSDLRGLAVVEIYKPDCEPCKGLQTSLEEISGNYSERLDFYKSHFVKSGLGAKLNLDVNNLPIVVLLKDGKKVESFTGAKYVQGFGSKRTSADLGFLEKKLNKFLEKSTETTPVVTTEQNPQSHKSKDLETKLPLSENSLITLRERYLKKDGQGEVIEKPEDMFQRVAKNISQADAKYKKTPKEVKETAKNFYEIMINLEFLPNSPTLMNAGRDLQQLSACFVLPIEDSIYSIFKAAGEGAQVHQSGGGTGFSFSNLRPRNSVVRSTSGVASGPTSFIDVFNVYTETVKQGGTRRGANMGVLRVDHPDIREFIHAKGELNEINTEMVKGIKKEFGLEEDDPYIEKLKRVLIERTQLNNFNLSVGLTEEFMTKLQKNNYFELRDPRAGKVTERVKAVKLLEEIVDQAWKSGDPGVIFLDKMNADNPTPHKGKYEATNPCGEQPLLPYDSCNLGSINVSRFVRDRKIDWDKLRKTVHTGVHFLDNVIDMNKYPLKEIEEMTLSNRKIGLGVMGFADMLTKLRIPYNADQARETAEKLMKFIRDEGRAASLKLAKERGVFPHWHGSIYDPKSKYFKKENLKLRNATITTIAPTGTLAMIADCEWGIEPPFSLTYTKKVLDKKVLKYHTRGLENVLKEEGYNAEEIFNELRKGKKEKFNQLPEEIRNLGITSMDPAITPEDHVRIQAAFQKYTDNAVSKTINFPSNTTREDIKNTILLAYQEGCKGITIYRDKSKDVQVLEVKEEEEFDFGSELPKEVLSITRVETVGDNKKIFVTIGYWENNRNQREIERLRKTGRPTQFFVDSNFFEPKIQGLITGLAIRGSKDLRLGISPKDIAKDLRDLPPSDEQGFDSGFGKGKEYVNRSIPEAISKAIEGWIPPVSLVKEKHKEEKSAEKEQDISNGLGFCNNCSTYGVINLEGCDKCLHCKASKKGCS